MSTGNSHIRGRRIMSATMGLAILVLAARAGLAQAPADPPRTAVVTIEGTANDREGRPIEGVNVRLFRERWNSNGEALEQVGQVETGADGRFAFRDLPAPFTDPDRSEGLYYHVVATRPGLSTAMDSLFSDTRSTTGLELALWPAGTLQGRVTNQSGEPVSGAIVFMMGLGSGNQVIQGVQNATTDNDGRYAIDDMAAFEPEVTKMVDPNTGKLINGPTTRIYFRVQHPDYGRKLATYEKIPSTVDVQLEPAGVIEGRVLDKVTGKPAVGVRVWAQGIDLGESPSARTDAEGRYRLAPLAADRYNVFATAPDRVAAALAVVPIKAGETEHVADITLVEGGWIVGKVFDHTTGQPTSRTADGSKIQIGVHGPSAPKPGAAVDSATVADDGTYRIRVAPGDNFPYVMNGRVDAERADGQPTETAVPVHGGETIPVDFRVRPED